jgi:hypothetical protein
MSALSSSRRAVDRLDTGVGELELRLLQGAGETLVLPGAPLGVDEEGEALVKAEGGELGVLRLGGPGGRQGGEFEGLELFEGLAVEHRSVLLEDERIRGRRGSRPLSAGAGEGLGASRSACRAGGHISVSPYGAEIPPVGTTASPLAGESW